MSKPKLHQIKIIDSHTGGEPTRIVVAGGPDLGPGSRSVRREKFQHQFDCFRSAGVNEPRGSDVVVGALLVEPEDKSCAPGVIGLSPAYYCARRGWHVTLVDRNSAQRDGCSFRNAGKVVPSHFIPLAAVASRNWPRGRAMISTWSIRVRS